MYFKQHNKRKDQPDEDIFESKDDSNEMDFVLDEKDIPTDTLFNKFVNWFRKKD